MIAASTIFAAGTRGPAPKKKLVEMSVFVASLAAPMAV
jgi:hypothetical protein